MKSAYGRQTPPPDYELTCVEPGSLMGELLRRYWQPMCTSDELRDLPKKVKLLCEELVVFRDKKGQVGALEELASWEAAFEQHGTAGLRAAGRQRPTAVSPSARYAPARSQEAHC